MDVLVAHGSKRGGTAEIARRIGDALHMLGFEVDVLPAQDVRDVRKYRAVVIGGALYGGHWYADARRLVLRQASALRERQVWLFSSGPLDDSAGANDVAPTAQVAALLSYVGANGHATFGGRLEPDAHGFVASAMAKKHAGDWRDMPRIDAWVGEIAESLESAPVRAPRPASAFVPLPSRAWIVTLCLGAGLSAIAGGACLVARPDGSLLGLPLRVLEHSPFHDFLVPGLLLLVVIGIGSTASAVLHLRRSDAAPFASAASGLALLVWMVVEMVMLRSFHPLQVTYLALAIAIIVVSFRSLAEGSGATQSLASQH